MNRVGKMHAIGLAFLVLGCLLPAGGQTEPRPTNGVAYVLLPKEIPARMDGVYRLNSYSEPYGPLALGTRIFDLSFSVATTVNGLAVDQRNKLFLFVCPAVSGDYVEVTQEGWIPPGAFEPDSPAYIKLIGQPFSADQVSQDITGPMPNRQYEHGTTNYDGDFWDYGPYPATPHYPSGWPHTHGAYTKVNYTDPAGNTCNYKFNPQAPASHKNLPLWNGPGAGAAGIRHPTDPYKVVLPNKWGGISWFAFGTNRSPYPYQLMDGRDGRPEMTQHDFRLKHDNVSGGFRREVTYNGVNYWIPLMSPYWDAQYISAVVKRTYKKRDRNLDLYSYRDVVVPPPAPPYPNRPTCDAAGVLSATDLDITESYGKSCGDGCIPGGEMNPQAVGKIESTVQVFTSTTGRRYGFNPFGKTTGPYGANDAALRVVHNGVTYNLDLNATNIRNTSYLSSLGYQPNKITRMGTSSKFSPVPVPVTTAPDFLYGSIADMFVMQDSWWGIGGLGFEYFANDLTTPTGKTFRKGHIYRLNYTASLMPPAEDVGEFPGAVDAIGVDGQGFLYVLTTELECPNEPAWPNPLGTPKGYDFDPAWPSGAMTSHPDFLGTGKWMRPSSNPAAEPDKEATMPLQPGDYLDIFFRQRVYKVARRYTASAGGGYLPSTMEERGRVEAGYDTIARTLEFRGGSSFAWKDGLGWRHTKVVEDRVANIKAEFAVVNIAYPPQTFHPPEVCQYSICRDDRTTSRTPIYEGDTVSFKLEGYKPWVNGVRQDYVWCGNFPELGGDTFVNMNPPFIDYDEDGDGHAGGFPSSIFESPSFKTNVEWVVELIDSADPNCDDSKVLRRFESGAPSKNTTYHTYDFRFPQPGNYRVYARVTYNYFRFEDLALTDRPSDLHRVRKVWGPVTTTKVLYQVQSDPNTKVDSYISNVTLSNQGYLQGVGNDSGGGDFYNLPENATPTALSFGFDAQFVRDANRDDLARVFETFGGVGVWDYGDPDGHVYNYEGPNTPNLVYNPGWNKPGDPDRKADHGTKVVDPLTEKDLKALRWRLFIYPTFNGAPTSTFPTTGPGELFAEGDCRNATVTQIGPAEYRKFHFEVPIPATSLRPINTPIDPGAYRLRLEIVYPRVKWIEYKTGPDATLAQYRSIVPDDLPVGVVTTVRGSDSGTAWNLSNGADALFPRGDSWFIRARDTEVGYASMSTDVDPIVQSTGDPVPPVNLTVRMSDNNPNVRFPPDAGDMQVRYQFPKYPRHRTDLEDRFKTATRVAAPGPKPTDRNFYQRDDYVIFATYTALVDEYSKFDAGQPYENWIGALEFSVEAPMHDGYGPDWPLNEVDMHLFTASATPAEFPRKIPTNKIGLLRYDNDPPSLFVTLISQADNRRWEIQLLEGVRDAVTNPQSEDQLADCQLVIAAYNLDNALVGSVTLDVPGSAKAPLNSREKIIIDETPAGLGSLLDDTVKALLPTVRRSGRLQANFRFTDNVDYLDFSRASFEIKEKTGTNLLGGTPPDINLANAYREGNNVLNPACPAPNLPRGRFAADMPMKVDPAQGEPSVYQVKIECSATDASGNTRALVIPVRIVDSSFETRVLESRENRR